MAFERGVRFFQILIALAIGVGLGVAALYQGWQDTDVRPHLSLPPNLAGVATTPNGKKEYFPPEWQAKRGADPIDGPQRCSPRSACWTDQYGQKHPQTRELDGMDPAPKPSKGSFRLPPHIDRGTAIVLYDMYRHQPR